ncbi:MAG: response regulator [Bacillota bacterium]
MIRILVVEDYTHNMRLIEQIIRDIDNNIRLSKAYSGKQAIIMSNGEDFDLVLMDIGLPDMDGFQVRETLKNNIRLKNVPIIAITAYATPKDEEECRKVFDDYISKPLDEDVLCSMVMKWIGGKLL